MSSTIRDGPPDKPRGFIESLYLGGFIGGALLIGCVSFGLLFAGLDFLYGVIGHWLFTGLPLGFVGVVVAAYTWRHIDPTDPFSAYRVAGAIIASLSALATTASDWTKKQYVRTENKLRDHYEQVTVDESE